MKATWPDWEVKHILFVDKGRQNPRFISRMNSELGGESSLLVVSVKQCMMMESPKTIMWFTASEVNENHAEDILSAEISRGNYSCI